MSKPKGSRFTLPGLALIVAVGSFGLPLLGLSSAQAGQALEEAKSGHKLQSLSELDDKAPDKPGIPPKAPGCCSSRPTNCRCSTCA